MAALALSTEWKMGKYMEWSPCLPSESYPQISPPLIIQNVGCNFYFYRDYRNCVHYYDLYLKTKETDTQLKSFSFIIYASISGKNYLTRYPVTFSTCNQCVFNFVETYDTSSAINSGKSFAVRFYFLFEPSIDLLLTSKTKTDEATQTASYADSRFMLENVGKDFNKLMDEGKDHDVHFICGDQTIRAHKSILCCRSDVLMTMLQSDMVEGKTGNVRIKDMDAKIFRQFLKYLYTGILPELEINTAIQFFKASDKYALGGLKKQSAEFLTDNLSLENACDILILADRHNDPDLKKNVMEYMFQEKIPVKAEIWTDFCKENQNLAIEVLNLFCQHLSQK